MADDTVKSVKATKEAIDQFNALNDVVSLAAENLMNLTRGLRTVSESIPKDDVKSLTIELSEMSIEMDSAKKSTESLSSASAKGKKSAKTFKDVFDSLSDKMSNKYPIAVGATSGAVLGLVQGFENVVAVSKGVLGFMSSLADTAFNVGLAILSIPFKLFNTLIDMAESGGGGNELARAYEEVRKEFGAFKSEAAATTLQLSKTFKGFNETGLSTFRIFGNLAERLQYSMELVKGFGMSLDAFSEEFKDHGGRLAAYQKGLGITAEEFRSFGDLAISTGRQLQDLSLEVTKYTLQFSGGVIDKRFSRQIQKAVADVKHFGGSTVKEIARAAAYAKGLHVELEKIVGVMDAFETFDSAAENSAKLAQSFGMVVDTFKMVSAQSPDEQIDMLRKSFFSAGKSSENFSRQQLALLSQTTGLNSETAKLVFSQKNMGKSLSDVQKEADKAKSKEMTQAQAMSKLADAIERLIKDGEQMKGGFFDQFFKGFIKGVQWTQEFWTLMRNIRISLREAFFEGIKFGKWFSQNFPGFTEMVKSLGEMFSPSRFRNFFAGIREVFQKAIGDLTSGKFSFPELMDNLKKKFFDFFDSEKGPGKKLLDSTRKMFRAFVKIFSEGIKWASGKLTEGLGFVRDVLSGKIDLAKYVEQGAVGGNIFLEMLKPIWEAVRESWKPLWTALKEVIAEAWKKLKQFAMSPEFLAVAKPVIVGALTMMFAPAILQGAMGAVSGQLATFFVKSMTSGLSKSAPSLLGQAGPQVTKALGPLGSIAGFAAAAAAVVAVTVGLSTGMDKFRDKIDREYSDSQKTVAAGATGIIDAITLGMTPTPILVQVANMFAQMTKSFESGFNKLGGNIGSSYMKMLSSNITMLSGIGDVFIGLFKGDSDKISDGIKKVFLGAVETLIRGFFTMVTLIPSLLSKLVVQPIANLVGNALEAIGLKTLGNYVKGIGELFGTVIETIAKGAGMLADALGGVIKLADILASKKKDAIKTSEGSLKSIAATHDKSTVDPSEAWTAPTFEDPQKLRERLAKQAEEKNAAVSKSATDSLEKARKELEVVGDKEKLKGPVASLKEAFDSMTLGKSTESVFDVAGGAFKQLDDLESSVKKVSKERLQKVHDGLVGVIGPTGLLSSLAKELDEYKPQLESATKSLQDDGVKVAMRAVADIVRAANDMNAAMSDGDINKLNIRAKLQRVANAVGLKGQKYTIDNKDVHITVNLTVVMEAGEVEKVIVQRKTSVIRDRLNHVKGGYDSSTVTEHAIPNTPEQPVQMIGGGE